MRSFWNSTKSASLFSHHKRAALHRDSTGQQPLSTYCYIQFDESLFCHAVKPSSTDVTDISPTCKWYVVKYKQGFKMKSHFFHFEISLFASDVKKQKPREGKMTTGVPCKCVESHSSASNKCMCVSVELESDLFRKHPAVCLCGCLSAFTSYKKHRQNESERKEGRRHICILRAPTFSVADVITSARHTHTHTTRCVGGFQAEGGWNINMPTDVETRLYTWLEIPSGLCLLETDTFQVLSEHRHVTEWLTEQQH